MKWWTCKECGLQFLGQYDKTNHVQWHLRRLALERHRLNIEMDKINAATWRWRAKL
jgi:hypothetical protein